jgi:predicted aminopeptidase
MLRIVPCLLIGLIVSGCSTIEFYWQGIAGQLELLSRAKPFADVLETTADPALRTRLQKTQQIREYASRELALPDNGSFRRYADIGRSFVVWNVFATPELSLKPRESCFPIAGCVAYRGYFAEDADGDDVYVGGVPAYSTLGYFDDPVLSTYIRYREPDLARLIFHELAHQIVYVKDDTSFNESFAVAVEEEGLRRWLQSQHSRPDSAQLALEVERSRRLHNEFRNLLRNTRAQLLAVYGSNAAEAEKRAGKAAAFKAMRTNYDLLKANYEGAQGFDGWFAKGANNAGIAAYGLYDDRVPQFAALLAAAGGDLPRFYQRVKHLAALPRAERDRALAAAIPLVATTSLPSAK